VFAEGATPSSKSRLSLKPGEYLVIKCTAVIQSVDQGNMLSF